MINYIKKILKNKRESKIKKVAFKVDKNIQHLKIELKKAIAYKNKDKHEFDIKIVALKRDYHKSLGLLNKLEKLDYLDKINIEIYYKNIKPIEDLVYRYNNLLSAKNHLLRKREAIKNGTYVYKSEKKYSDSFFCFSGDSGHCSDSGGDCGGGH